MPAVDPLILEMRAEDAQFRSAFRNATRIVDQESGRQERRVRQLENEMRRSSTAIGNTFKGLAASLGTYFTGRELVGLIDSFTRFQNQLRVAGLEGDDLLAVQERLRESASRYGVSIEALAGLFGKATQAGRDLGASQSELLNLTDATAQALLITGTSTQAASGAILGLSQALASGTVRAEEFNQMNEGGLAPLLQAAAASERFGGSIGKLRQAVVEGTVSSREFYTSVLQNSQLLANQASQATLTLSGAFTALRNELTLYFGDAARSNGVTTALAEAIKGLSDNLNTIIPALAVIATLMTGRFVGAAIGGGRAMQALAAHVSVATTSMAGLRLAAGSTAGVLLGALGGIPGLAISAALAIGYVVLQAEDATEALEGLRTETEKVEAEADAMEQKLRAAGVEVGGVGDSADDASGQLRNFWDVIGDTVTRLQTLAKQAGITRAALIGTKIEELQAQKSHLETQRRVAIGQMSGAGTGLPVFAQLPGGSDPNGTVDQQRAAELDRQIEALKRQQRAVLLAGANGISLDEAPPAVAAQTPAGLKRKAARGGPSAEDLEDRAARTALQVLTEIEQLNVDRLHMVADLTRSAEDRAAAELAGLKADRAAFDRQVALDADLTDAQRRDLAAARDAADAQRARAIEIDRLSGLAHEQAERESSDNAWQQELADMRGRVNDRTARERRMTALRLIDLQFSEREDRATREYEDAQRRGDEVAERLAFAKLGRIEELKRLAQEEAKLADMSPLEELRDTLNRTRGMIAEDVESVEVEALRSLEDGLVDAIRGAENLGDVFSAVADQIIADLIRIAVQQAIIRPIAELLGGGIGGPFGFLFSAIGSIFGGGRAGGGSVSAGRAYMVGERGPELMIPRAPGTIIPNEQLRAGAGGSGTSVVRLELSGDIDARIQRVSGPVAIEVVRASADPLTERAVSETFRRAGRPGL